MAQTFGFKFGTEAELAEKGTSLGKHDVVFATDTQRIYYGLKLMSKPFMIMNSPPITTGDMADTPNGPDYLWFDSANNKIYKPKPTTIKDAGNKDVIIYNWEMFCDTKSIYIGNLTGEETPNPNLYNAWVKLITNDDNETYGKLFYYSNGEWISAEYLKGDPGEDGDGIESITHSYGISTSGETIPSSWELDFPNITDNKGEFLWTKYDIKIENTDEHQISYTCTYIGKDGKSPKANIKKNNNTATITIEDASGVTTTTISDGEKGLDGKSIESATYRAEQDNYYIDFGITGGENISCNITELVNELKNLVTPT